MIIHGKDILILDAQGNAVIAAAKSCTIHTDADAQEVSSTSVNASRMYIAGRNGWTVSLSYLVTAPWASLLRRGQTISIRIRQRNTTGGLSGTAIVRRAEVTATKGSLAQGAWELLGTGDLTQL